MIAFKLSLVHFDEFLISFDEIWGMFYSLSRVFDEFYRILMNLNDYKFIWMNVDTLKVIADEFKWMVMNLNGCWWI